MIRAGRIVLLSTVLFVLALTACRAYLSWHNDAYLDPASGVLATLASDFKDGLFYRPLYGPAGYGGTRYQPLWFVLHAELWKLTGDFRTSGYALSAASTLLLLAGVFHLLRRLHVDRRLSFCCAGLLLASESVQIGLHGFHSDSLAAGLSVWGLAICAGAAVGGLSILGAALLFTLAFTAKLTSVVGITTAFLTLCFSGRSRTAWRLLAATLSGYALAVGIFCFASQGRWWENMRACATAGASTSRFLFLAGSPFYVVRQATSFDPGAIGFLLLACMMIFTRPKSTWKGLPQVYFLVAWLLTGVILTSPGASVNHLSEVVVAALIFLPVFLEQSRGETASIALAGMVLATLFAVPPQWFRVTGADRTPTHQRGEEVVRLLGNVRKPVLAENPIVQLMLGQRPYLEDSFMFRAIQRSTPAFGESLRKALRDQEFSAVVLTEDPWTKPGRTVDPRRERFDEEIYRLVQESYELVSSEPEHYVFLPRKR